VLGLHGEFDLSGVPLFQRELKRALAGPAQAVALDLRGLTFVDSSGLRALIVAHKELNEAGRPCVVVKGPQRIHKLLEITGLKSRFNLVDDLPDPASEPS
jgi:anti-anti-sigma factor